jgi:hypothetical protein
MPLFSKLGVCVVPKGTTPAQLFARIFALFMDKNAPRAERDNAERQLDAWLRRHGNTRTDIPAILVQAAADDAEAQPPPPSSDPRDHAPHPFNNPEFTPAGLVEGIVAKYVIMKPHVRVIYSLWICFTHVYTMFAVAPRVALTSEDSDSGKTTALKVARPLVYRPNPEVFGTGAAIGEFIDEGPGTVLLDELDLLDAEGWRRLQQIWNLGHERGAKISLVIGGKRKLVGIHAPMLAAGVGSFLAPTQKTRTFNLEMEPYTEQTKPERKWNHPKDEADATERIRELDAVYSYLRHWAAAVKLDPAPRVPPGVLRRFEDNVCGLLAIADSCGPEWGRRAREAIMFLLDKEKAEHPKFTMIRHGLAIFDALELDQIRSTQFNQALKQLDVPDARWTRYRGPSGIELAHPLEMHEQAALLEKVGIESTRCRPPRGKQFRGYKRAQFEEAWRKHGAPAPAEAEPGRGRLRLISSPQSD